MKNPLVAFGKWAVAWPARLTDFIFGYDIFISYSWDDGSQYPTVLNQQLEAAGFKTFLDKTGSVPGIDLKQATRRRVRMSTVLIVVMRPCALRSHWVLKEVQESLAARRSVIAIDVNQTFEKAPPDNLLKQQLSDWLRLHENLANLDDPPSEATVSEIRRRFTFTRRETLRLRVVAASVLVLFAALAIGGYQYFKAGRAERTRRVNQLVAEANELASDPAKLDQAVEKAGEAVSQSSTPAVVPVFRQFLATWPPVDVRTITCNTNTGGDCDIDVLRFAPDGSRLAVGTGSGNVFLLEAQNQRAQLVTHHAKQIQYIGFGQDGRWILSLGANEFSVRICAIAGANCFETPGCGGELAAMAVAPSSLGNMVVLGGANQVCLVDLEAKRLLHQMPAGSKVQAVSFSSDGKLLAAIMPRTVQVWSIPNWELKQSASLPEWEVATMDPAFKKIIVSRNKEGFVVDIASGRPAPFEHPDFIREIDVSPDGTQFVTAAAHLRGTEYAARWLNLEDLTPLDKFPQAGQVTWAKFLPDGAHLLTASGPETPYDASARLWSLDPKQLLAYMRNEGPVTAFAIGPNGKIATGSWNGVVRIWNTAARIAKEFDFGERILRVRFNPKTAETAILYRLGNGAGALTSIPKAGEPVRVSLDMLSVDDVAYSPNGEQMAVAGDSAVTLFQDGGRTLVKTVPVGVAIESCDFLREDKLVVSAKDQILVINIDTGAREIFEGGGEPLSVTPDGTKVAVGLTTNLRLIDLTTHKQVALPGAAGAVSSTAFSSDGRILVAGYRKNSSQEGFFGPGICLWNTQPIKALGCVKTADGILSVAVHPSEGILASGDEFGTLQLWDLWSHEELVRWKYPPPVETLSFDATGKILRVAVYGTTSRHVEIESAPWKPADLLRESCLRSARQMSVCGKIK